MASPVQIASGLNIAAFLYSPHRRLIVLCDGSLLAATQTSTGTVTLSICANPTAATQTWSALAQTFSIASSTSIVVDLYAVHSGTTSSDVWVCLSSNDGTNGASVVVAHGTYTNSGQAWSWDNTGTNAMTVSAGQGAASIIWDGTNLIVVSRDGNSTNNRSVQLVWTTTKNGSAGWQAKAALSSVTTGNSHMLCLLRRHPSSLGGSGSGGTICIYINDTGSHSDRLATRVLLDSAASPAVANWSSEVQQAQTALSGIGLSATVDPASGNVHVAYTSSTGTGYTGLNYFPVTVAAGVPAWGTHQNPDTTSTIATTAIGVDASGQIWLFYGTGAVGSAGVIDYRTSSDGVTFSALRTTVASTTGDGYPHVPVDYAISVYVPLAFQRGTATFTTQSDNTLNAPAPASSLVTQFGGLRPSSWPFLRFSPGLAYAPPPSSTAYNQALSAGLSFAGAFQKTTTAPEGAAISFAGDFQIGPGDFLSTQIQTGISGGPSGNNTTETDIRYTDGSGNGWMVGIIPAYGAAVISTHYEIAAGVVSLSQTSLGTSNPDGFIHCLAQTTGGVYSGTEDPAFTLTEVGPTGTYVRRYYDSGTLSPSSGPALNWRVRTVIQPGDPGFLYHRIDITNPSGTAVSLGTGGVGSLDLAVIGGLTQVAQGGSSAWPSGNAFYANVGAGSGTAVPIDSSPASTEPDLAYVTPTGASGLVVGVLCVAKDKLSTATGGTSPKFGYASNSSRLKLHVGVQLASFPGSTTYTLHHLQVLRRNLTFADANAIAADYLNPDGAGAVSVGTFSSYSYDEGCYVLAAGAGNRIALTHTFAGSVSARWNPFYKLTGYTASGSPLVTLGGSHLVWGTDYISYVDTANQVAYVKLLKSLVASGAGAGQLNNGLLSIAPTGVFAQAATAVLSLTGAFSRATGKALAAGLSFAGAQSRAIGRGLTAGLSFAGASSRSAARSLSASLSFTGAQSRAVARSLAAGLSFAGSIAKRTGKALAGALSFSGLLSAVKNGGGTAYNQALSATLSFTGAISRGTSRGMTAALSFAGSSSRAIGRGLAAGLSFAGQQARSTARALTAALPFTGAMGRATSRGLAGAVSFAGAISRSTGKALQAAALSFSGLLSAAKNGGSHAYNQTLTAALSFAGAASRTTSRALAATLPTAGAIGRGIGRGLTASLAFAGGFGKGIARALGAALSFVGSLLAGKNGSSTSPGHVTATFALEGQATASFAESGHCSATLTS